MSKYDIVSTQIFFEMTECCLQHFAEFAINNNKNTDINNNNLFPSEKMDGHWGNWASWGQCTKTCDEGKRVRTRECENPKPENGGKNCKGKPKMTDVCRLKNCQPGELILIITILLLLQSHKL